ncbi:hypothetical protein Tco_1577953 [Tanacetum coccineum]
MAPRGRPTRLNPGTTPPPVTDGQGMAMTAYLGKLSVRRTERVARECTYQDFMKCQPLYFKGTERVIELTQWCFDVVELPRYIVLVMDVANAMNVDQILEKEK